MPVCSESTLSSGSSRWAPTSSNSEIPISAVSIPYLQGRTREAKPCARPVVASTERLDKIAAGSFTATAYLGAHAAMLVFRRVLVALVPACLTGDGARLEHRPGQVGVIARVPGQHAPGCRADIRAVKAGTDAFGQVVDVVFTEAGVCTRCARLVAFKTRVDTCDQLSRSIRPRSRDRSPAFSWRRSLRPPCQVPPCWRLSHTTEHGCVAVDIKSMACKRVNCPRPPECLTRVIKRRDESAEPTTQDHH